jgi:hypothetical protein
MWFISAFERDKYVELLKSTPLQSWAKVKDTSQRLDQSWATFVKMSKVDDMSCIGHTTLNRGPEFSLSSWKDAFIG